MSRAKYEIRGTDKHGSGAYGASRGSRTHKGVDLITLKDEMIGSFCCGVVTKIGYPYNPIKHPNKGHFRYVQVTDVDGIAVRSFYLNPLVEVGDLVEVGSIIGQSQDLLEVYEGMTQHIHVEIKKQGEFLNPVEYLRNKQFIN